MKNPRSTGSIVEDHCIVLIRTFRFLAYSGIQDSLDSPRSMPQKACWLTNDAPCSIPTTPLPSVIIFLPPSSRGQGAFCLRPLYYGMRKTRQQGAKCLRWTHQGIQEIHGEAPLTTATELKQWDMQSAAAPCPCPCPCTYLLCRFPL